MTILDILTIFFVPCSHILLQQRMPAACPHKATFYKIYHIHHETIYYQTTVLLCVADKSIMAVITSNWSVDLLTVATGLLLLLYLMLKKRYNYWKERGVPYVKPIPFFGNYLSVMKFDETISALLTKLYK